MTLYFTLASAFALLYAIGLGIYYAIYYKPGPVLHEEVKALLEEESSRRERKKALAAVKQRKAKEHEAKEREAIAETEAAIAATQQAHIDNESHKRHHVAFPHVTLPSLHDVAHTMEEKLRWHAEPSPARPTPGRRASWSVLPFNFPTTTKKERASSLGDTTAHLDGAPTTALVEEATQDQWSRIHKTVHVTKNDSLLAQIELHTLSPDILKLRDVAMIVDKERQMFTASNGIRYAWVVDPRNKHLELKNVDVLDAPAVAVCTTGSYTNVESQMINPAVLDVSDTVIAILDEVVATYVFISRVQSRKKDGNLAFRTALGSLTPTGIY